MNGTIDAEVARYAGAVRAALGDLPGPDRELLLEDLEDHLQEVAAEAGGPLTERLGAPEAYAAELRASAGLPDPGAARRPQADPWLRRTWGAQQLGRLWRASSGHPAGRAVIEFLPELRPAWWVARGYLAVQAASVILSYLWADNGLSFPIPQLFGSRVLGLLATAAAVVGSVALGRRAAATGRAHGVIVLGNAALALFALFLVTNLGATLYAAEAGWDQYQYDQFESGAGFGGPGSGLRADGREIANIYAFDAAGKPLADVYLVDQDGHPLVATRQDHPELEARLPLDRDGNEVHHRYPQQQSWADPATGQRIPQQAPGFRPPPGMLPVTPTTRRG